MKAVRLPIRGNILQWARVSAGFTVDEIAKRMHKEPADVEAWEAEAAVPTLNQLRTLAGIYKRPLGVLFRSTPPRDKQLPHDFRRMPGTFAVHRQPEVIAEIRSAQERRDIALMLYDELGEAAPEFRLSAQLNEDPETVGTRIRDALGITTTEQVKWRDYYVAFNSWRTAIEMQSVMVFQFSRIKSETMRGFSLAETLLPVMGLNRSEVPQARCFSALHEFTHLMLRMSGVCDFGEDNRPPEEQRVEIFCNAVAGAALVPLRDLLAEPLIAPHPSRPRAWEDETIAIVAKRYKVSREMLVRRLVTASLATNDFYRGKRAQYLAEQQQQKEAEPEHAIPERGAKRTAARVGVPFGRLVLSGYHQDLITLSDVTNYLGMKLRHLSEFESAMGMG